MKKAQIKKSVSALAMAAVIAVSLFGYGCGAKSASTSSDAGVSGDFTGTAKGFGGGITEVLPLDKDYDYLYDVGSYVVHLQVKDGTISFQDSQCPDHVCEQFGQLSEEGAWAACVPAGVYVKLAPLSEAEAAS